jgi:hypothetical protein
LTALLVLIVTWLIALRRLLRNHHDVAVDLRPLDERKPRPPFASTATFDGVVGRRVHGNDRCTQLRGDRVAKSPCG